MSPQLAAYFAAHRTAILGGGAAAVAGLALLRRKRAATVPAGATAGATVPGTIPAAAVAGPTAGYDSSNYDVYSALQPELEQLRQTIGASAAAAPAPASSPLLNNTDWENTAIKGWSDFGQNPLDMQAALGQYLAGQPINTAQESGVGWAIHNYGAAPQIPAAVSPIVKA